MLLPEVLRLAHFIPGDSDMKIDEICIIDGDIVESKNIMRQNFYPMDVGKYKSEVLATRYSLFYPFKISYITEYITESNIRSILKTDRYTRSIIIDTVDKKKPRVLISQRMKNMFNVSWISLGNSKYEGQAVYSPNRDTNTIVDHFPDTFSAHALREEQESESNLNCAIQAVAEPQTMAINRMSAIVGLNLLYSMIYEGDMEPKIVFFNCRENTCRTVSGRYSHTYEVVRSMENVGSLLEAEAQP